ncbi:MAG: hypothetical protein K0U38_02780 [Epsilonproteobacteria bacterium]|nr:hypothetical protein [Campylobacterota bacterium]
MKFFLLSISLLWMTGCFDNTKVKKDKNPVSEEKERQSYTVKQLELKEYLTLYLQQLQSLNTDNIIAMTYPKLFVPINKNIFQQYINTLLTSEHISVESFETNITNIGTVYPYSNGEFSKVSFHSTIKLNFINPELYSDELSVRVLNDVLTRKYGKDNIKIDSKERTIVIKKEEKLLSLKDNGEEWKFMGDNPAYREVYPRILPSDLLSKI